MFFVPGSEALSASILALGTICCRNRENASHFSSAHPHESLISVFGWFPSSLSSSAAKLGLLH